MRHEQSFSFCWIEQNYTLLITNAINNYTSHIVITAEYPYVQEGVGSGLTWVLNLLFTKEMML